LAEQIMRRHILPVARKLDITKRIGWHTFRHTYSTLLRSTGAELKTMQDLLRHSTIRVTLDTYTQAVTTEKRKAQEAMVALLFPGKTQERELCLGGLPSSVPILCLFVPTRKWSAFGKFFRKNGGDDETRTRDLCRDSGPVIGFTTTYKTAGTAKSRVSR
jgi:hypothetical protein